MKMTGLFKKQTAKFTAKTWHHNKKLQMKNTGINELQGKKHQLKAVIPLTPYITLIQISDQRWRMILIGSGNAPRWTEFMKHDVFAALVEMLITAAAAMWLQLHRIYF